MGSHRSYLTAVGIIPDGLPTHEVRKAVADKENKFVEQRQQIHDFQSRVDEARAEAAKNGVTAKKVDDLGADLALSVPDAVRSEMAGASPAPTASPTAKSTIEPTIAKQAPLATPIRP